jgi:hypothetical protein
VDRIGGKLVETPGIAYKGQSDGIVGAMTRDELGQWKGQNYLRPIPNLYHGDFDQEAAEKGEFLIDGVLTDIGEKLAGHKKGTLDVSNQEMLKKVVEKGGKIPSIGNKYRFPLDAQYQDKGYHHEPRSFGSSRNNGARYHAGCDLYAPVGSKIYAMADGLVIDHHNFYGQTFVLVVNHNGKTVRYGITLGGKKGDNKIWHVYFTFITGYKDSQPKYRLLDKLVIDMSKYPDDQLTLGSCECSGKIIDCVPVAIYNRQAPIEKNKPISAWLPDTAKGKLVPIDPSSLKCESESNMNDEP